jgi:hypothetical protein
MGYAPRVHQAKRPTVNDKWISLQELSIFSDNSPQSEQAWDALNVLMKDHRFRATDVDALISLVQLAIEHGKNL